MNYFKITLGIFIALGTSRFIPHPPNFTSLVALSFYVPAFLGLRYIPALIIGFVITDYFIGFHQFAYFTWGAVICIGLVSEFLKDNYIKRISGTMLGAVLFFFNYQFRSMGFRKVWFKYYRINSMFLFGNTVFWLHCAFNNYFFYNNRSRFLYKKFYFS